MIQSFNNLSDISRDNGVFTGRTYAELLCARVSLLSVGLTVSLIKPVITPESYKHRPETIWTD